MLQTKQSKVFIFTFIAPTLLFMSVFYVYPFLRAFYMSFFNWRGLSRVMTFIGLDNFRRLISDPIVFKGLYNNLYFLLWGTIIIFSVSLFFSAVLARKQYREKSFYRVVFFFPNILSIVVIGLLWMFIYNPSFGLLNELLKLIGFGNLTRAWLGEDATVMPALIVPQAWMVIGFYMILFLAAMQNVPEDYYESAIIDGAGEIKQFRFITVPLIWEVLRTALVFFVINAFRRTFVLVLVMTKGGPSRASELLTTYMYEQAFAFSHFGYGTAIGVFLFLVTFVISITVYLVTKRDVYEY